MKTNQNILTGRDSQSQSDETPERDETSEMNMYQQGNEKYPHRCVYGIATVRNVIQRMYQVHKERTSTSVNSLIHNTY